ncbi:MAG: O-methyltransferase [Bacteroidota bacterium]|nr:O-methyltransferase [Bacteroidota bacterium]
MEFLPKQIERYALEHTAKENELLEKLNRETWAKVMTPRMLSGHMQGRVLSLFSKLVSPENILEIGTYTGYSALCLAEGLNKNGQLHTIDCNEEVMQIANRYFGQSDYSENIVPHIGNALEIIPTLDKVFQLVFIDADKENYCNYFDLVFDKIALGGIIISDNVLWSGKVVEKVKDEETESLVAFSKKAQQDERVENILMPIRDGLMICRKISS